MPAQNVKHEEQRTVESLRISFAVGRLEHTYKEILQCGTVASQSTRLTDIFNRILKKGYNKMLETGQK